MSLFYLKKKKNSYNNLCYEERKNIYFYYVLSICVLLNVKTRNIRYFLNVINFVFMTCISEHHLNCVRVCIPNSKSKSVIHLFWPTNTQR